MAVNFYMIAAVMVAVSAAPPGQQRYQQQPGPGLHQLNPLDYFLEQSVENYYRQGEQKQASGNSPNRAPARLESLEPDSEVELVPGVQQPQQPPQQNPVAPNIPGLLPGQRVFIVHMPVPGYSPGSIGGYQPVYIVAAAPQGNGRFPSNGFQNTVLLDPSGQGVLNPFAGYPRGILQPQVLGQLAYPNRPHEVVYADHGLVNGPSQPIQGDAARGPIHFSQMLGLQGPLNPAAYQGAVAQLAHQAPLPKTRINNNGTPAPLKQGSGSDENKEAESNSNHRAQALTRNKA